MALRLVTSPRNAIHTPATASFQTQTQAAVLSPKASSAPIKPVGSSFFGIPRDGNVNMPGTDEDLSRVDPDELFARFTVAQVKSLALRLKAESDAKQEELRLMVGERYRDLLQASTSIIDMANSSQTVVSSLEEMQASCSEEPVHRMPAVSKSSAETDSQLKTLQSLAAHMKLLLDSPEHFWKLLERKDYLSAAWLYKVAQLVYHSLTSSDEDEEGDEERWIEQGIDVMEQFPLVQRQWDAINSFRGQISHKAMLSLREDMDAEETLQAVASMILLDSMSLDGTLTMLLSHRGKSVHTFFLGPASTMAEEEGATLSSKRSRKKALKDVENKLAKAIELLVGTMSTARLIYAHNSSAESQSSIERLIADLVSGSSDAPISTAKVLNNLPSAPLLDLYLPPRIKNYTPYIDTSESSFNMVDSDLSSKLEEWLDIGLNLLRVKIEEWLSDLNSAADVEEVRSGALSTGLLKQLDEKERKSLVKIIDEACSTRLSEIWKVEFVRLKEEFEDSLRKALDLIKAGDPAAQADLNPGKALLSGSLPFPPSTRTNQTQTTIDSAFLKFNTALSLRRTNRTPLLDAIISTVESQTQALKKEVESISGSSGKVSSRKGLIALFEVLAEAICKDFTGVLQQELEKAKEKENDESLNATIFIGRVATALATSESFSSNLLANGETVNDFKEAANKIQDETLFIWRSRCITRIMKTLQNTFSLQVTPDESINTEDVHPCTKPSSSLLQGIVSLIADTHRLGMSKAQLGEKRVYAQALEVFAMGCLSLVRVSELAVNKHIPQLIWDVIFVQVLCEQMKVEEAIQNPVEKLLDQVTILLGNKASQSLIPATRKSVTHSLPQFRLLLSPFIAPPEPGTGSLTLPRAGSSTDTPTIELAKPSSRFGLLLVPSAARTTLR